MNRILTFGFLCSMVFFVGCGGGEQVAAPSSTQDELAKYAAENPSPPETPVD